MTKHLARRAGLGGLAAAAALAMLMAAPAPVEAQTTLRFAHWLPPTHSNHRAFEQWAESLKTASNGEITVQFFPAQQLGAAADHYDMARDGVADITHISAGYQAGRFPIAEGPKLPFMVTDALGGSKAVHQWYVKYAEREMNDVKVCNVFLHAPSTIHSKTPVRVPADIRGMKVRPAHSIMAQMVSMLGGSSVQLSAPESREAIERGVADAITFPWGSLIRPWGIDKAVTHHLDMPLYVTVFVNVMNKAAYDRLTDAQKQALDAHCTAEWSEKLASIWAASEKKGYEELKAREGHTVYTPTPEEVQLWREATAPLVDQWKKRVDDLGGLKGDEVLGELQAALRANNALME